MMEWKIIQSKREVYNHTDSNTWVYMNTFTRNITKEWPVLQEIELCLYAGSLLKVIIH